MTGIFLKLLNMSISASWLVLAVLILRLVLKKSPKWISCLLWGVVALRLVLPVSVQSLFSLVPSAQVIPGDIAVSQTPAIYSGIPQINNAVNPAFTQQILQGTDSRQNLLFFLAGMWLAGVLLMLLYSAITYLRLRWQVRASVLQEKRVYICDHVISPFILGVLFPKIYIPSGIAPEQLAHVLAHEQAHLRRRDHWWKPLGFLLLSVYWFNPLLWLGYILLCRDIERACDEKAVAALDGAGKKGYSEALIACSVHRRTVLACPVAFGEVGVKARIKGIVSYKKPAFWVVVVSLLICTVTAVCFLTDPVPCDHTYTSTITVSPTCTEQGMQTLKCKICQHSYTMPAKQLAHRYDAGTVTQAPTCTARGEKQYACVSCGETKAKTLELLAHTAGELTVAKEPNCTQTGEATSVCTQCQTVFVAQILETNDVHDIKQTVTTPATCSSEGTMVNVCSRCDHKEEVAIEKLEHSYEMIGMIKGTCTNTGFKDEKCTVCGHKRTLTMPKDPNSHMWISGMFGQIKCMACGKSKSGTASNSSYGQTSGSTNKKESDTTLPVIQWAPNPGEIWVGRPPWL